MTMDTFPDSDISLRAREECIKSVLTSALTFTQTDGIDDSPLNRQFVRRVFKLVIDQSTAAGYIDQSEFDLEVDTEAGAVDQDNSDNKKEREKSAKEWKTVISRLGSITDLRDALTEFQNQVFSIESDDTAFIPDWSEPKMETSTLDRLPPKELTSKKAGPKSKAKKPTTVSRSTARSTKSPTGVRKSSSSSLSPTANRSTLHGRTLSNGSMRTRAAQHALDKLTIASPVPSSTAVDSADLLESVGQSDGDEMDIDPDLDLFSKIPKELQSHGGYRGPFGILNPNGRSRRRQKPNVVASTVGETDEGDETEKSGSGSGSVDGDGDDGEYRQATEERENSIDTAHTSVEKASRGGIRLGKDLAPSEGWVERPLGDRRSRKSAIYAEANSTDDDGNDEEQ